MRISRKPGRFPRLHTRIFLGVIIAVIAVPAFLVQPARAEIVLRSVSSTSNGSGATSITINKPAGVAVGDVMIASVAMRSATGLTTPSGWTSLRWDTVTGNTLQQHLLYRVATSADSSVTSYNFSWSVSEKAAGAILAYSGVDPTTPIQGHNGTTIQGAVAIGATSITTTAANSKVIGLFSFAYPSTVSSVSPTAAVKRYETISSGGGQAGTKILVTGADRIVASAAASGQTQVTVADAADAVAQHLALNPSSTAVAFQQAGYRWYQNQDSSAPGAPLAAQDTSASVASGSAFRLRQILKATGSPLNVSNGDYKLQYAAKSGTCDASFTGETYTDVQLKSYATNTNSNGTAIDDTVTVVSAMGWTQPSRASGSNNQYATTTSTSPNGSPPATSRYLKTSNYGFSIPANATIRNVDVGIEGNYSGPTSTRDYRSVQLLINDTLSGSSYSSPMPSSESITTISFGQAGLTPADINSANFGVSFRVELSSNNSASIDDVAISVEYELPTTSVIRYNDNATVTNGTAITSTANDPSSGGVARYQQYVEDNLVAFSNVADILGDDDAIWDFSLIHDGATPGTYCMRVVNGSGSVLNSYSSIPEITIGAPVGPTLTQQLRGGQAVVNGVKSAFTW